MKISFKNVCFRYNSQLPDQPEVLKDINLDIANGEFVAIVGPSGSGKTTLLQHFTGLLRPSSGSIYVEDRDIWGKNYPLQELRRRIGLVFQFPESQLFERTVFLDVAFAPMMQKFPASEVSRRVNNALRLVGLDDEKIQSRSPHQLSQGEKRRVAIAGVLAMEPEVLALDEPTAGLDPMGARTIVALLNGLHSHGKTIIFITHYLDLVFRLAPRMIVLNQGRICYDGKPIDLFHHSTILEQTDLEPPRVIRLIQYLRNKNLWPMDGNESLEAQLRSLEAIISHRLGNRAPGE